MTQKKVTVNETMAAKSPETVPVKMNSKSMAVLMNEKTVTVNEIVLAKIKEIAMAKTNAMLPVKQDT